MSGFSIIFVIAIALLLWSWFQRSAKGGRAGFKGGTQSERKLVKAVGRSVANRLIDQLHQRNPDRSRDWCADKALFDWERDRRY